MLIRAFILARQHKPHVAISGVLVPDAAVQIHPRTHQVHARHVGPDQVLPALEPRHPVLPERWHRRHEDVELSAFFVRGKQSE